MFLILLAITLTTAIYFFIRKITYWTRHGIPQDTVPNTLGRIITMFMQKQSFAELIESQYKSNRGTRYWGTYNFTMPVLMIKDADLLKELTVKSFDYFPNHTNLISEANEPLWARNLFALKDQKWREMRPVLSPSFTSSKMRMMFQLISECAQNFAEFFLKKEENIVEVELKDTFTRFTNDVIASAAFGIKIDSLEEPKNEFYSMGKRLTNFGSGILITIKFFIMMFSPRFTEITGIKLFEKEVTAFFMKIIEDTLKLRREKGIVRSDMIHLLMEAQKGMESKENEPEIDSFAAQNEALPEKKVQKELSNVDIAAQALIFFFAGFESVSSLMCFMAYELATHQDIQERLIDEIDETFENCNGSLTYEALLKMKYLDMVVSESLRKWPSGVAVDRECVKPYTIEPKSPDEKPIHLKPKDVIWIPIFGIHRDPENYPEPEKFDPERFNDENKSKINPYNYVPFGAGPRNCIGSRFALLEIKIVFFSLLRSFKVVPVAKSRIPLKLSATTFNLGVEGGFWFGLEKRKK